MLSIILVFRFYPDEVLLPEPHHVSGGDVVVGADLLVVDADAALLSEVADLAETSGPTHPERHIGDRRRAAELARRNRVPVELLASKLGVEIGFGRPRR